MGENISQEAEKLVGEIGQADKEEAQEILEQFSSRHSITVTLKAAEEEGVSAERADEESAFAEPDAVAAEPAPDQEEHHISAKEPTAIYEFQYKDSPEKYTLLIEGINHTAVPLTTALNQVLFPLMAVVFILALIVSAFYSRYITRPVIEISEASKKMASLDFDILCDEARNDELGVLSGNLNELSRYLSAAMEDLNRANVLLKEDVAREKELEGQQLAFFSAVSHELKTPITILKGQLQGMLYSVGGYKDRDKYLKRAYLRHGKSGDGDFDGIQDEVLWFFFADRRELSRNRATGGSGLGLFIVRMVLELHHFSYGMENTEDGIRFSTVLTE